MLRRRLFYLFGPLVTTLLIAAVAAMLLLQQALVRLDRLDALGWASLDRVGHISSLLTQVHAALYQMKLPAAVVSDGDRQHLAELNHSIGVLSNDSDPCCEGRAQAICEEIRATLPAVMAKLRGVIDAADDDARARLIGESLGLIEPLRIRVLDLAGAVREHLKSEQVAFLSEFRKTVIGLTVVFVIVVNVAVVLLVRAAGMVVRPVESLVAATRELGEGRFDHRLQLPSRSKDDEFGQLSAAVNGLAAKLQAGEARQLETLSQVARAMNHEINNVISIIDLQLKLLSRQNAGVPDLQRRLSQVNDSLARMTHAVRSLQNVRRIVLTDYLPGMKMLDLERSQLPDPPDVLPAATPKSTSQAAITN